MLTEACPLRMSDGGADLRGVEQNASLHIVGTGIASSGYLTTFGEMWYQMFLWALFSSLFVHVVAAAIAFATLRKHRFGKFFPVFILVMGVLPPLTSGVVSCAVVALVYKVSNIVMAPLYALLWGVGQTVVSACVGFTRILATL